ncbi:hypothetical protein AXF42_Ash006657 [Apostasia shenzhenica]|uniref:EF-hand domain-containing protein n=1 Tax=Apostasia shenzhenica TaxID=1088818 RepID=A0A2I0AIV4_9ASPA|nr:hypothetical protein AXF42_Ash006657 [Apostasia shenzhenica]
MPIIDRSIPADVKFREWLQSIDRDRDGRVSEQELREALRALGRRWTGWKAARAMKHADLNRDSFIDGDAEIGELMSYAANWGIVVTRDGVMKTR